MNEEVKQAIEKRMNDPKIHGEVIGIISELKKEKMPDIDILAIGILITKLSRKVVETNGDDGRK